MPTHSSYYDAYSRAVFLAFKKALEPTLANVAPDWLLHHIEILRPETAASLHERVEIRLVLKPIGQATWGAQRADLATGPKRLPDHSSVR